MPTMLTIGEVSRQTGIAASALRFYEAEGLIPKPPREQGRRIYPENILDRLALIGVAKSAGFSLSEIKRVVGMVDASKPPGPRLRKMTEQKQAALAKRRHEIEQMESVLETIAACHCPSLQECAEAIKRA